MEKINVRKFKAWCAANAPLAEAVLLARAFAELERERVNAYVLPIFAKYEFWNDLESEHGAARVRLDKPDLLYLSKDEKLARAYFDECDAAHRVHGFSGPADHCPALAAENLFRDAKRALINEGAKLFEVNPDLLFGPSGDKFYDLIMGACVKALKEAA